MSEALFNLSFAFERIVCASCGIPFAAPDHFFDKRRETHKEFFCPNGHSNYFPGETKAERIERELVDERERHQRTLARLNAAETKGRKLERKVKRIARGVCPCCKRTFTNVARHMVTMHPEEVPKPKTATLP